MCVIIIKDQANKKVSKSSLVAASVLNPHGLGVLWLDSWNIEYFNSEDYSVLDVDRPYVAHFRYATVGKVSKENCHPFNINKNTVLFQNGTVRGFGNKNMTDTEDLAKTLGKIPKKLWKGILEISECRFVIADLKNKSIETFNDELWTMKDGVMYSKKNVLDQTLVAVYGTLKRGNSNNKNYLGWSTFVGSGVTKDKYRMISEGIPYVSSTKGIGNNIYVDLFLVDNPTLKDLDGLESHPSWYKREETTILMDSNEEINAWLYFNDTVDYSDSSRWISNYSQYGKLSYSVSEVNIEETSLDEMEYELCFLFQCLPESLTQELEACGYENIVDAYYDLHGGEPSTNYVDYYY